MAGIGNFARRRQRSPWIAAVGIAVLQASVFSNAARAESDIVDTAVQAGQFSTLVAAVKAADLVSTLKSKGPFTVFAPTDEAFARLPAGTVENLLKPENRDQLVAVLTYHVVAGEVPASKVVGLDTAETVLGANVDINVAGSTVMVNESKVIKTDIACSNGIIHVIDNVLLPPSTPDIVDTAMAADGFKTLVAAAKAAGLVDTLKGKGPFTVFAPTDEAFAKLPAGTLESLLDPKNRDKLVSILTYHVVPGKVLAADVVKLSEATTAQGSSVSISAQDGVKVNNANVIATDIECGNGVIHVIDQVLLPPEKNAKNAAAAKRLIQHAIHSGVPAYNSGNHCQCAHIYTYAMMDLLMQHKSDLSPSVRSDLMGTLDEARHTSSAGSRAWVLRRGLDRAYMSM